MAKFEERLDQMNSKIMQFECKVDSDLLEQTQKLSDYNN